MFLKHLWCAFDAKTASSDIAVAAPAAARRGASAKDPPDSLADGRLWGAPQQAVMFVLFERGRVANTWASGTSVHPESNLDCEHDRDGFSVSHCGLESIPIYRIHGVLVQAGVESLNYLNVLRHSLAIDY